MVSAVYNRCWQNFLPFLTNPSQTSQNIYVIDIITRFHVFQALCASTGACIYSSRFILSLRKRYGFDSLFSVGGSLFWRFPMSGLFPIPHEQNNYLAVIKLFVRVSTKSFGQIILSIKRRGLGSSPFYFHSNQSQARTQTSSSMLEDTLFVQF